MLSRQNRALGWLALAAALSGLVAWQLSPSHPGPGSLGLALLALASDLAAVELASVVTLSAAPALLAALALSGQSSLALLLMWLGPALRLFFRRGRDWPEICCELSGRALLVLGLVRVPQLFPTLPREVWIMLLPLSELVVALARQSLELVPGQRRRWREKRRNWWRHDLSLMALVPLAMALAAHGALALLSLAGLLWLLWRGLSLEAAAARAPSVSPIPEVSRTLSQALGRQQSQLHLQNRRQNLFWELSHRLSQAQNSSEVATQGLDYLQLRLHVDRAAIFEEGQALASLPIGARGSLLAEFEAPRPGLCQWSCPLGAVRRLSGQRKDPLLEDEVLLLQDLAGLLAMAFQASDRLAAGQRLMSSLVHSSTIAAVGQLAAGMAHELNSPLAAIQLQLELASKRAQGTESLLQPLQSAGQSLATCRELLQKLTYYSRDGSQTRPDLDLNSLVRDSLQLLGGPPQWQLELAPVPPITGNPGELQQALFHLFHNAREASPQGPWRVTTVALADRLRLTVEDLGPGLDEVVQQRMFEPFFSTRTIGKNRGLGLSVARQIVEHHGGRIAGHNRTAGPGACFWIELPLYPSSSVPF